jgi:hypothetical protein
MAKDIQFFTCDDERPSLSCVVEELIDLMKKPGVPRPCIEGFSFLLNALPERMAIKIPFFFAPGALPPDSLLKASDLFLRYQAAVRACDWERVAVVEHELRS